MNINFTPANRTPNFQARFSDDERTKIALRELAKDAPTMLYQAHLALKDNPSDDKIAVRRLLFGQYDVINKTTSDKVRIDNIDNDPYGLLEVICDRKALFNKNESVPTNTYKLQANAAVRGYKKAAMPEGMAQVKSELDLLNQQIMELEAKREPVLNLYKKMEEQQANDTANAIINDIYA